MSPKNFNNSKFKKFARQSSGMMMASTDFLITIPVVVLMAFFVMDAALGSYYKQRLGATLDQAAEFGANCPEGKDVRLLTEQMARDLLRRSAVKALKLKLAVKEIEVEGNNAIEVTATGEFPLLEGTILPVSIPIKETAVALIPVNKVCGFLAVTPSSYANQFPGRGLSIYLPVVKPKQDLPVWSFPFDTAIGSVSLVKGMRPDMPLSYNPKSKDALLGRESVY
ncbi:MAG: hypothetical protein IAF58_01350 [Leptolyngbya sp.]|nr:hypothetical protein [Candidatus Melainabacteria bacterium]